MTGNATLDDFQDVSQTAQNQGPEIPDTGPPPVDELTINDVDPPDRPFNWKNEIRHILDNTAAIVEPAEPIEAENTKFHEVGQFGYIAGGKNEYLEKYGDETLETPPSFNTSLSEVETYIAELSTKYSDSYAGKPRWGRGISPEYLLDALRLATGWKPYRQSDVTITACEKFGFVIEYKDDAFIFATTYVSDPDETIVTKTVDGITIENEENADVLAGFKRVKHLLESHFDFSITGFKKRTSNALIFTTDYEEKADIKFKGEDLLKATTPKSTFSNLEGEYEYETLHTGETYTYRIEKDCFDHTPGEPMWDSDTKLLIGYTLREKLLTKGFGENEYGVSVKVIAKPYFIEITPKTSSGVIGTNVRSSNVQETVASFEFDTPDHPHPKSIQE